MMINELVAEYINFKRALGFRFDTNTAFLKGFIKVIGRDCCLSEIKVEEVLKYLDGSGELTRTWHAKHNALKGMFRYAIRCDYLKDSQVPLPTVIPKLPPTITPYIYSNQELKRLIGATESYQKNRSSMEPITMRTILLLLYGAGLRGHEALTLRLKDVDLKAAILTIEDTKFNKSRLVPIGKSLTHEMKKYLKTREKQGLRLSDEVPFFLQRSGNSIVHDTVISSFQRIREHAGVYRNDNARYQPRLHDLRHTFAVHRILSWYRQGKDVQRLLHHLSVYLGHAHLAATQSYLSMIPELLDEANSRFEDYALGEEL